VTTQSKLTLGDQLRTLEAGIKANLTDVQSIVVVGAPMTIPDITAKIDSFLAAQTNTLNLKNSYHAAVVAEQTTNVAARAFRTQMEGYCITRYGKTNPILSQFGFTPTKSKKSTTAVKAVAVLKVKATRAARHTMGKVQKKAVKGTVDPSIAEALATAATAASAGEAPAVQVGAPMQAPAIAPIAASAPAATVAPAASPGGTPGAAGAGAGGSHSG
jgi:hypothetical protein